MLGPRKVTEEATASCTRASLFPRRPDKQLTEDPHFLLQQLALLRKKNKNKKQTQSYLKNTQKPNMDGSTKDVKTVEI